MVSVYPWHESNSQVNVCSTNSQVTVAAQSSINSSSRRGEAQTRSTAHRVQRVAAEQRRGRARCREPATPEEARTAKEEHRLGGRRSLTSRTEAAAERTIVTRGHGGGQVKSSNESGPRRADAEEETWAPFTEQGSNRRNERVNDDKVSPAAKETSLDRRGLACYENTGRRAATEWAATKLAAGSLALAG